MLLVVTYAQAVHSLATAFDGDEDGMRELDDYDIINQLPGYVTIRDLFEVPDKQLVHDVREAIIRIGETA